MIDIFDSEPHNPLEFSDDSDIYCEVCEKMLTLKEYHLGICKKCFRKVQKEEGREIKSGKT